MEHRVKSLFESFPPGDSYDGDGKAGHHRAAVALSGQEGERLASGVHRLSLVRA